MSVELVDWLLQNCVRNHLSDIQISWAFDFTINKLSTLKPLVHDSGIIETEKAAKKTTDLITLFQTAVLIKILPVIST